MYNLRWSRLQRTKELKILLPRAVSLALLPLSLLSSCIYQTESPIPNAPVYYQVDFASAQGKALIPPGGYLRVERLEIAQSAIGYGGLLIFHSLDEMQSYYAYDLACPHESKREVRLMVNSTYEAECPTCHSRFSILYGDGSPLAPPARLPLRRYAVKVTEKGITVRNQ